MQDNDYSLPISFSLAAQIGLEESVLLTFLRQRSFMAGRHTLSMDVRQLNSLLPFWTAPIVMRLLTSLQMSHLIQFKRHEHVLEIQLLQGSHTSSNDYKKHSEDSSGKEESLIDKMSRLRQEAQGKQEEFTPQPKSQPLRSPPRQSDTMPATPVDRRGMTDFDLYLEQKERARQPDQWQPEDATLEQIAQAGITREFALSLQAEFLLRIKEQRKNVRTWNSEFFKYVKRQWQYKQADRSSYEGTSVSPQHSKTSREQVSDALTNIHDTDW